MSVSYTHLNPILGLNIVEYAGNNQAKIDSQVTALCQQLDEKIAQGKDHIIGYQLCSDLPSIERIYAMRKKAVGLLGNAKGDVYKRQSDHTFISGLSFFEQKKTC